MSEILFNVSLFLSISWRQVTITNHPGSIQSVEGKKESWKVMIHSWPLVNCKNRRRCKYSLLALWLHL